MKKQIIKINSGIYKITNKINKKVYIGSAINIRKRIINHKSRLRRNTHDNPHLQSSYNKYGLKSYTWEELEIVEEVDNLLDREQFWMDHYRCYDREFGYNCLPTAGSNWKMNVSDETRMKLKLSHIGHKRSKESHDKIISKMNKKVYQIDMNTLEVVGEFSSCKDAEEKTGARRQLISMVCRRITKSSNGYYWTYDKDNFKPLEKYHYYPEKIRYIVSSETGERWKTLREAGEALGLTKNQIYTRIKWKQLEYQYEYRRL